MPEPRLLSLAGERASLWFRVGPDAAESLGFLPNGCAPAADAPGFPVLLAWPEYYDSATRAMLEPSLIVQRADGVIGVSLQDPEVEVHPDRVILRWRCERTGLRIVLTVQVYAAEDVWAWSTSYSVEGDGPLRVSAAESAFIGLPDKAWNVERFTGIWGDEVRPSRDPLPIGQLLLQSRAVTRASMVAHPALVLLAPGTSETEGETFMAAYDWPGSWRMTLQRDGHGLTGISAGLPPAGDILLGAGETLDMPPLIVTWTSGGRGQASRNLHGWLARHRLPNPERELPIDNNSWEGVYFSFDEPALHAMIDGTASMGAELFVLDDGWFGGRYPRNDDLKGLGDWQVNRAKLPGGLEGLAERCAARGLRFGLWVEPEMVNPKSELYERHPEWAFTYDEGEPRLGRHQLVLDLNHMNAFMEIESALRKLLEAHPDIAYVKWDANCEVTNPRSRALGRDEGRIALSYGRAYLRMLDRVRELRPDLILMACGSGGGRASIGALSHHDEFWASDNTDARRRVFMHWAYSTFYPARTIVAQVSRHDDHHSVKFRCDVALAVRFGFSLDPRKASEEEMEGYRRGSKTARAIRPFVQFGEWHRGPSPYEFQISTLLHRRDEDAVALVYRLADEPLPEGAALLPGLDPGATYELVELNVEPGRARLRSSVATGTELAENGLDLQWFEMRDSTVVRLTRSR